MPTTSVDTTSAGYQTRLTQIQEIKSFYGPIIAEYLRLNDADQQTAWRQADPILRELLDIHRKIEDRKWQL